MNAQVVEVGGKMLEAPGPKAMHFTLFKDKTDLSICSDWRVGGSEKRTDDCISGWGKGKTYLELKFNCGLFSFCQVNTKAQKLSLIFVFCSRWQMNICR